MKIPDADKQRLFKSRDPKPPYASVRVGVMCSETFTKTAKELLFELPGRPFKSVSELYRHALAVGLISMAEHGVKVDRLRDILLLQEEADSNYQAQQAAAATVLRCKMLLEGAETLFQEEHARRFVERAITMTPDPEMADRLKKLLGR